MYHHLYLFLTFYFLICSVNWSPAWLAEGVSFLLRSNITTLALSIRKVNVSTLLLPDMHWARYGCPVCYSILSGLLLFDLLWSLLWRLRKWMVSDRLLSDMCWTLIQGTRSEYFVSGLLHSDIYRTNRFITINEYDVSDLLLSDMFRTVTLCFFTKSWVSGLLFSDMYWTLIGASTFACIGFWPSTFWYIWLAFRSVINNASTFPLFDMLWPC